MNYDVIIDALQDTIAALNKITTELSGLKPEEPEQKEKPKKQEKQEKPKHSFEEVRGVLAKLSADGMAAEVRELLTKFGAKKLSEINEEDYESILQEAKKICR